MTVYLLHFDTPISPTHTTQHYLGYAKTLEDRIAVQEKGKGARLVAVALERDIQFTVARTWRGGRKLERQLKNRKNSRLLCPICKGKKK